MSSASAELLRVLVFDRCWAAERHFQVSVNSPVIFVRTRLGTLFIDVPNAVTTVPLPPPSGYVFVFY